MRCGIFISGSVAVVVLQFLASESLAGSFQLVRNSDGRACRSAADIVDSISPQEFVFDDWRGKFGGTEWQEGSWRTITAEGREERVHFAYSFVDIDNDSVRDVAVRYTSFLRSVLVDKLFVMHPKEFASALEHDTLGKIIHSSPAIKGQSVWFTDGTEMGYQEIGLWINSGSTYVLLKEYSFGRENAASVSSFVVAKLEAKNQVIETKRLLPTVVCRFSWNAK
jgi:hypothetical protein